MTHLSCPYLRKPEITFIVQPEFSYLNLTSPRFYSHYLLAWLFQHLCGELLWDKNSIAHLMLRTEQILRRCQGGEKNRMARRDFWFRGGVRCWSPINFHPTWRGGDFLLIFCRIKHFYQDRVRLNIQQQNNSLKQERINKQTHTQKKPKNIFGSAFLLLVLFSNTMPNSPFCSRHAFSHWLVNLRVNWLQQLVLDWLSCLCSNSEFTVKYMLRNSDLQGNMYSVPRTKLK